MRSRCNRHRLTAVLVASLLGGLGLVSAGAAQASSLPTMSVAITPSSATVTGALESGGVNVVSTDTGVKEAFVILLLFKPGVSVPEAEAFATHDVKGDPNNVDKIGSIVLNLSASPGQHSEVQAYLAAGQYLLLDGSGEGQPQPRTSFVVGAATAPAMLPTPEAKISAIEFGFRGPSTLHDGELVRFENEGFLVHMNVAFPVKGMKAAEQAKADLLAGNERAVGNLIVGPPVSFVNPVSSGAYQQETITGKPGVYIEVCFMDTQDHRSHAQLGMERIIRITK